MNMYLVFSAFTSRPISLQVTNKVPVFFLIYLCFHPINYHHQHKLETDVYHSVSLLRFAGAFVMTFIQQSCRATLTEHLSLSDIRNRTIIRKVFAYPDFTIGFIEHIFFF